LISIVFGLILHALFGAFGLLIILLASSAQYFTVFRFFSLPSISITLALIQAPSFFVDLGFVYCPRKGAQKSVLLIEIEPP
jgi:hypothetical protein